MCMNILYMRRYRWELEGLRGSIRASVIDSIGAFGDALDVGFNLPSIVAFFPL
jgi:hypothetical protein